MWYLICCSSYGNYHIHHGPFYCLHLFIIRCHPSFTKLYSSFRLINTYQFVIYLSRGKYTLRFHHWHVASIFVLQICFSFVTTGEKVLRVLSYSLDISDNYIVINILNPDPNGCYFADDNFKMDFLEHICSPYIDSNFTEHMLRVQLIIKKNDNW